MRINTVSNEYLNNVKTIVIGECSSLSRINLQLLENTFECEYPNKSQLFFTNYNILEYLKQKRALFIVTNYFYEDTYSLMYAEKEIEIWNSNPNLTSDNRCFDILKKLIRSLSSNKSEESKTLLNRLIGFVEAHVYTHNIYRIISYIVHCINKYWYKDTDTQYLLRRLTAYILPPDKISPEVEYLKQLKQTEHVKSCPEKLSIIHHCLGILYLKQLSSTSSEYFISKNCKKLALKYLYKSFNKGSIMAGKQLLILNDLQALHLDQEMLDEINICIN